MVDFGLDKVKGLRDGDVLEATDFSRFWSFKKLKLNGLAKGVGSDSFTIHSERI